MKTLLILSLVIANILAQNLQSEMTQLHNSDRENHKVSGLVWDNTIARHAQICAQKSANRGAIAHDCKEQKDNSYGENLAGGGSLTTYQAYKMWYNEEPKYNYNDGRFSAATGHFTQVVWKGTTSFGCGRGSGKTVVIDCLYKPAGNMRGEFRTNVMEPRVKRPRSL